jgi:hypothetical protein
MSRTVQVIVDAQRESSEGVRANTTITRHDVYEEREVFFIKRAW